VAGLRLSQSIKTASRLLEERTEHLPSGVNSLDLLLLGGFPKGRISEVSGAASSGKTSVTFSALARAISQGEVAAYIDGFNTFDPFSAVFQGIDLQRLLWVRCGASAEKAALAADLIARGGGFGLVILDLAPPDDQQRYLGSRRIPSNSWFRLKQTMEGTKTVLLVLSLTAVAGSAASLVLNLKSARTVWKPELDQRKQESLRRGGLFEGLIFKAEICRGRNHGVITLHSRFQS
jgi:hypothetical protein